MKIRNLFLLVILSVFISCSDEESESRKEMTDGFCLAVDNKIVVNHKDIDYYDFSEHKIHLKSSMTVLPDTLTYSSFDVYADKELIYSGNITPYYSSMLIPGPVIYTHPFVMENNSFRIQNNILTDQEGNSAPDQRTSAKVAEALMRYRQFRE